MKPNITLSQLSHLGITPSELDDVLSDHEILVTTHMTNAARKTTGNVLGVGITALTNPGNNTDKLAFLLLVDRLDYANQTLPTFSKSGYQVLLEEVGSIRAQSRQDGDAAFAEDELESTQGFQAKYRPVTCGVSIAPGTKAYSGTLGCQVMVNNVKYMLSNNHVLADCNSVAPGTVITQPSIEDHGNDPADVIGALSYFVPLAAPGGTSPVDAAIAAFDDTKNDPRMERGENKVEKMVAPVTAPYVGMEVQKSGRTTGVTKGKVTAIALTIATDYAGYGVVTIQNTFSVKHVSGYFSLPGDSGSVITTASQNNPVGLLFAGDQGTKTTYANTMQAVLKQLTDLTGHEASIVY
ncbi:hypothetical protein PMI16_04605 [Herbaspirillum sp. CF444]|uniref:hypothetical protein n=1 Tax=Herbaspirillum sp. CF444 TaxID=1144319 RepID=UPI0002727F12|nr:hypothetical protein [Herbaspirillum sp. CF444]EJL81750.1 hypothetical protein PMI16_04605 [Herbaspirillum sp. CF444]